MRILVTGGSGFIGTNLIEFYLTKGFEILNIDIKKPKIESHFSFWKEIDIRNFSDFNDAAIEFQPDFIINLAARANLTGKSLDDYSSNILGVENLIKIANELNEVKRVIFTSTMLVCKAGHIPLHDEDYCPPNLYGESKAVGEQLVRKGKLNFDWTIVRPTSIWGPWFGPTYRGFFLMIMHGRYFNFSGKMSQKTYGYIGNTVYQIDSILNSDRSVSKTYYLGDYSPTCIKEWANEIGKELNQNIITVPRFAIWSLGKLGDLLQKIKIKFPMNSFRFENMTTDNVVPMVATQLICPDTKYTRIEGIKLTLNWIRDYWNH